MFALADRRAWITGAGSGIGLAIAKRFHQAGAAVVLADLPTSAAAERAAELGGRAESVLFDVSDEAEVEQAFAQAGTSLDILVSCAGVAHVGTLSSTSVAEFDRLFAVNVRGTFLCMRAALPALLASGRGAIVNLASIAATSGLSDRFAYSMTKGAVASMTLSVAKDYLAAGLRCNSISPARIHTPFVDGFLARNYPGQEQEKFEALSKAQPIGRMGRPEEVAALALYLCSDEAGFVTGADYLLDGGFSHLR